MADSIRADIAHVSKQILDLESAYFAGTAGVESSVLPLGSYKVVNKKTSLVVRREQRIFSLSSSSGDGGAWPETAHSSQSLAAMLTAAGARSGNGK
jgi:hypothetical protein